MPILGNVEDNDLNSVALVILRKLHAEHLTQTPWVKTSVLKTSTASVPNGFDKVIPILINRDFVQPKPSTDEFRITAAGIMALNS